MAAVLTVLVALGFALGCNESERAPANFSGRYYVCPG